MEGHPKLQFFLSLVRFFIPLALTNVLVDIGEQALYRGIANSNTAIFDYAGFGIAYVLTKLFSGLLSDFKKVSLVLVNCQKDRRKVLILLSAIASGLLCFVLLTGLTDFGDVIINQLHHVSGPVAVLAKRAIIYVCLFPLLDGIAWVHAGILIKFKHSVIVSCASIADIVVQIIVVAILLQSKYAAANALIVPTCAVYCGTIARMLIVVIFYYYKIHRQPTWKEAPDNEDGSSYQSPTYIAVVLFWLPLASVQFVQRISRPLVNLFVIRDRFDCYTESEATKALAVMSVCYPIAHVPYGWLNELRAVESVFIKKPERDQPKRNMNQLVPFYSSCLVLSMVWMFSMFWIPGVSDTLLAEINKVDKEFYIESRMPLKIFSSLCIPVFFRAIASGHFIRVKNTKMLYVSPVSRLATVTMLGFILPRHGIHGAVMGVTALVLGYVAEASSIYLAIIYLQCTSKKTFNMESERIIKPNDEDISEPEQLELS